MTTRIRARTAALAAAALAAAPAAARAGDVLGLMPEAASAEAAEVDHLTYTILWITGAVLVGVQALLVWFLVRYRRRPGVRAKYTHGNHAVELVWTVTPALILVFLALYQVRLWVRLKSPTPEDNANPVHVQILARQFEWNFRYPGPDGAFDTGDDLLTKSALVLPVDRPVNATLRSMDVVHSFFLPNFRFKQDAVPGLSIPIWFRPNKVSAERLPVPNRRGEPQKLRYWDIVCAELCGALHTSMAAQLYVVPQADFEKWLSDASSVPGLPAWAVWNKERPLTETDLIWSHWSAQDPERRAPKAPAKKQRTPLGIGRAPPPPPQEGEEDF